MKKQFSLFASTLFLFTLTLVTSCKKEEDTPSTPTPKANVMVVHASPDAPGVDLLVDNTKVNSAALTFLNNTGYLQVNAGTRNVKVNAAGTTTTVIDANLGLEENKSYSVFATGILSNISPLVIEDNLATPAAGKAHVRFIHLCPDAPAVDIAVASTGAVVFGNKSFRQYSDFTPLDAGTYNLDVRPTGTAIPVLALPAITLEAGKIYTVYAKGLLAGSGDQAVGAQIIVNK
jgi:hypothetical protein